jgi:hypothetical protein
MSNPFVQTLARLQLPAGAGRSISISGLEVQADEDGVVEVPQHLVDALRSHGLTEAAPAKPAKAPK